MDAKPRSLHKAAGLAPERATYAHSSRSPRAVQRKEEEGEIEERREREREARRTRERTQRASERRQQDTPKATAYKRRPQAISDVR